MCDRNVIEDSNGYDVITENDGKLLDIILLVDGRGDNSCRACFDKATLKTFIELLQNQMEVME